MVVYQSLEKSERHNPSHRMSHGNTWKVKTQDGLNTAMMEHQSRQLQEPPAHAARQDTSRASQKGSRYHFQPVLTEQDNKWKLLYIGS